MTSNNCINANQARSLNLMDDPPLSINDLPNEILLQIFFYLSVEDIALNVQFVCSRWSEVCSNDVLWKNSCLSVEGSASIQYVVSLLKKVPKLQCFCIWFRSSGEVLNRLAEFCKDLRKLDFCVPQLELPYEAFKNLVSECPKLEEITIPGSALVREELAELVGQWEYLNDIYLIGRSDKPIALKYLAEGCPALQHLHMRYVVCSFTELEYFLEKKKNKLLSLSISPLTQDGRCVIPLLDICKDRLEKLQLEDSKYCYIESHNFGIIKTLKNLKALSIKIPRGVRTDVMSDIFEEKALSQLQELELNNYAEINDTLVNTICSNCPNLLRLALRYSTRISDDAMRNLHKCKNLEDLDLYYCTELTDVAVDFVLKCSKLKYLNLGFCKLTEKSLTRLIVLTELRELILDAINVASLPLQVFPQHLTNLRELKLDYCMNIDNEALAILCAEMPHLRVSTKQAELCP
ncbi:dynein regulatory complex subunit 6-like isoform X2 [Schistocerca americana]|uniref:dynein regulatory complex subunit 6-like isoform X2 n=1 Tax=Schistocerca americana TaxID=7009 RepID=UPI001F503769|nr:dynein regulatory complex subunit 6-like isoform X2 [Schistocerca americana]